MTSTSLFAQFSLTYDCGSFERFVVTADTCDGRYLQFEGKVEGFDVGAYPDLTIFWIPGELTTSGDTIFYGDTLIGDAVDYVFPEADSSTVAWVLQFTVVELGFLSCDQLYMSFGPFDSSRKHIGSLSDTTYLSQFDTIDYFQGDQVLVLGHLILDTVNNVDANGNSMVWVGTDIMMAAGSSMYLEHDVPLTLRASKVHGCRQMWDQITIAPSGRVESFWFSVISDARIAFNIGEEASVYIQSDSFINNATAFQFEKGSSQEVDFRLDNSVVAFDAFLTYYKGQSAIQPSEPRAIYARNVSSLSIGDFTSTITSLIAPYNVFDNLSTAVSGQSSNIAISNTRFENCDYGVLASGPGGLLVTGLGIGAGDPTTFTGITAWAVDTKQKMDTRVVLSKIDNSRAGIRISDNPERVSNVEGNDISVTATGVLAQRNYPLLPEEGVLAIRSNTITVSSSSASQGAAVVLRESINSDPDTSIYKPLVRENFIDMVKGRSGIIATGPIDFVADDNYIHMGHPNNRFGILMEDTHYATVQDNTIEGVTLGGSFQEGIVVKSSPFSMISCNYTDSTRIGLRFSGASINTNVVGNTMGEHRIGLYYRGEAVVTDTAFTGDQYGGGNEWIGSYPTAGARHDGEVSQIELSRYFMHVFLTSGSVYAPPSISLPNASTEWFLFDPEAEPQNCATILAQPENSYFVSGGSRQLAQGEVSAGYFTDQVVYNAQSQLYESLLLDGAQSWQSNPTLDSFYQAVTSSSIGTYHYLEDQIHNWLLPGGQLHHDMVALDAHVRQGLETHRQLRSQLAVSSGADSIALYQTVRSKGREVDSLFGVRQSLEIIYDSVVVAQAQQIRQINSGASATEVFEVNTRSLNDIYLSGIINGGYTTAEKNELHQIANQCPLLGGPAVYRSRALLSDTLLYDDTYTCAQQGLQYRMAQEEISRPREDILLTPNPADRYTAVVAPESQQVTRVELYDAGGRRVADQWLQSNEVNVSHLSAGLYICRLYNGKTLLATQKLLVQ